MSFSPPLRPLVVLDCDSTTIQDEVIELLADAAGTREEVAEITERAMRGELDFSSSLYERVATLAGVPERVFEETYRRVRLTPGIRELISAVHERDGLVCVVSGGFHEVVDLLAADLSLDRWRANRLEVVDGTLTGRLVGDVIDAVAKADALREWAAESGIPLSHTIAIGDGANDLKMMEISGISVAFNAKPVVREHATVEVDHDLALAIPLLDQLSDLTRKSPAH